MATKIHLSAPVGPANNMGISRPDISRGRWFLLGLCNMDGRINNLYAANCIDITSGRCILIGMRGQHDPVQGFVFSGLSDDFGTNFQIGALINDQSIRFIRFLEENEFVGMTGRT